MLASAYPILSFSNLELEGKWQEEGVRGRKGAVLGRVTCLRIKTHLIRGLSFHPDVSDG